MAHLSRFTQLLAICFLVIFVPTFLYLGTGKNDDSQRIFSSNSDGNGAGISKDSWSSGQRPKPIPQVQGHGAASSLKDAAEKGGAGSVVEALHPNGPAGGWTPKVKTGDFWRGWKEAWGKDYGAKKDKQAAKTDVVDQKTEVVAVDLPKADGGAAFASKMANATAKAELGRATWKFLHTMTLRYPDHPTPSQRETLQTFFHTFALLYPCGECANHFQELLKEMPPQTSSRMAASLWLCAAHNKVNDRLGKEEFPCDKLDATYDCGCGVEDPASTSGSNVGTETLVARDLLDDPARPLQGRECLAACNALAAT